MSQQKPAFKNNKVIEAIVPRSNLFNFESDLRLLSSGAAICSSTEHFGYRPVPQFIAMYVINKTC